MVGLERTIYTVSEDGNVVELCARVFEPAIDCPIEFPFDIAISTAGTTGIYMYNKIFLLIYTLLQ